MRVLWYYVCSAIGLVDLEVNGKVAVREQLARI